MFPSIMSYKAVDSFKINIALGTKGVYLHSSQEKGRSFLWTSPCLFKIGWFMFVSRFLITKYSSTRSTQHFCFNTTCFLQMLNPGTFRIKIQFTINTGEGM
ncbi:unnamed protein product, partial [Allacma fusca]